MGSHLFAKQSCGAFSALQLTPPAAGTPWTFGQALALRRSQTAHRLLRPAPYTAPSREQHPASAQTPANPAAPLRGFVACLHADHARSVCLAGDHRRVVNRPDRRVGARPPPNSPSLTVIRQWRQSTITQVDPLSPDPRRVSVCSLALPSSVPAAGQTHADGTLNTATSGRPLRTAGQPPGRDGARPTSGRIFVGGDRVQPVIAGRLGCPCFHAGGFNEPV